MCLRICSPGGALWSSSRIRTPPRCRRKEPLGGGTFAADLSSVPVMEQAIAHMLGTFGQPPDVLINKPGVADSSQFEDIPDRAQNLGKGFMSGHGVGVGDINSDGRMEIVTPKEWWEHPPKGSTQEPWTYHAESFGVGGAEMGIYDVNGDGMWRAISIPILTAPASCTGIELLVSNRAESESRGWSGVYSGADPQSLGSRFSPHGRGRRQ
jgi:hypothetical protein